MNEDMMEWEKIHAGGVRMETIYFTMSMYHTSIRHNMKTYCAKMLRVADLTATLKNPSVRMHIHSCWYLVLI